MNKKIFSFSVILIPVVLASIYYYYRSQKIAPAQEFTAQEIAQAKELMTQDIAVFFNYAQEKIPQFLTDIEMAEKETPQDESKINYLKEELKTYKIAQTIAQHDLKTLEEATPEQLSFKNGDISVEGDRFKYTGNGRLTSRMLAGENALAFVLFHSAMDKTQEDQDKTMAMLKILFNKKLDPNTKAGEVYWVKDKPTDKSGYDYVSTFSLSQAASIYSFPQAQQLLHDYIKNFKSAQ
ncbi:MAG TPA: hypothetical protein VGT41_00950 [Candidatus Babeliales bacterium]|nr:hypothetical protein [Candidatus Babeliales bacterium]